MLALALCLSSLFQYKVFFEFNFMQQSSVNYNYPTKIVEEIDGIVFSSNFDSGNLGSVKKDPQTQNKYLLTIKEDCGSNGKSTNYRTWFYFSVTGIEAGTLITFTISNMSNQARLFKEGMAPVFRTMISDWQRVKLPVQLNQPNMNSGPIEITFRHLFEDSNEIMFAFTYPWSLEDTERHLKNLEMQTASATQIYFHRTPLIYSKEGRKVELVTITSSKNDKPDKQCESQVNGLFPDGNPPMIYPKRKYIFVSARVHPGELPSSHVMNGLLNMLLDNNNPNSEIARENFVWVLVPQINPDGVYRGHYRTDAWCQNLNRYYLNPSQTDHPSIYAVKEYLMRLHQTDRLYGYIDLHAHATHRGIFIFGNNLSTLQSHTLNCLFPRLVSFYSEIFDYEGCNFTEKNMHAADKSDGLSKDGAGRVALHKATNLVHSYTLECNYNSGRITNKLYDPVFLMPEEVAGTYGEKQIDLDRIQNAPFYNTTNETYFYKISDFELVGHALISAFLDINQLNTISRIPKSPYQTLSTVKLHLAYNIMKQMPFRFDPYVRRVTKNLTNKEQVERTLESLYQLIETGNIVDSLEAENPQAPQTRYQKAQEIKQSKKKNDQQKVVKQNIIDMTILQQQPKPGSSNIRLPKPQSTNDLDRKGRILVPPKQLPRAKTEERRINTPSRIERNPLPVNQFRIKKINKREQA